LCKYLQESAQEFLHQAQLIILLSLAVLAVVDQAAVRVAVAVVLVVCGQLLLQLVVAVL
jgi:hypothetical protein